MVRSASRLGFAAAWTVAVTMVAGTVAVAAAAAAAMEVVAADWVGEAAAEVAWVVRSVAKAA